MSVSPLTTAVVIPAKLGSRRLPGKNFLPLGGKPLLAHSIETALDFSDFVLVVTDKPSVAALAIEYGASAHIRAEGLPRDPGAERYALDHLDLIPGEYNNICLLYATCPMMTTMELFTAEDLLEKADADSIMGVTEPFHPVHDLQYADDDGYLRHYFSGPDEMDFYVDNGSFYMAKRAALTEQNTFMTDRNVGLLMPKKMSIDVDDEQDMEILEAIWKNQ